MKRVSWWIRVAATPALIACSSEGRTPPTITPQLDPYNCSCRASASWLQALETVVMDQDRQCPANIEGFGSQSVRIGLRAKSRRTDMVAAGSFWRVRDGRTQVGGGSVDRIRDQGVDWAIVEGTYLGGDGNVVQVVSPTQVLYRDSGLIRVNVAGHPAAEITTLHHVLRTNQRPILGGTLAPIVARPASWFVDPNGGGEQIGFRYVWYVDGVEVVGYSTQHTLDYTFSSEGWHTVQVRIIWANDAEQWETRNVHVGPECGLDNCQFLRLPSSPPSDLPDARTRFAKSARVLR